MSCDTFTGAGPLDAGTDGATAAVDGSAPDGGPSCESEPLWANQAGGPAMATCGADLQDLRSAAQHCGRCDRRCPGKKPNCEGGYCVAPLAAQADIPLAVDDTTLWYGTAASGDLWRINWQDETDLRVVKGGASDSVVSGYTLGPYMFARTERGLFRFDTTAAPPPAIGANLASNLGNGRRRRVAALDADRAYALDSGGSIVGPDGPPGVNEAWELAANPSFLFWAQAPWRTDAAARGTVVSLWDPNAKAGRIEHTSNEGAIHSLAADAEYIYWMDVDPSAQGLFRHRIGGAPTSHQKLVGTNHAAGILPIASFDLRQQMLFVDDAHVYYWELVEVDGSAQPHFRLMKVKKCGGNAVPLVQDCSNLGRTALGAKFIAYACNNEIRVVTK